MSSRPSAEELREAAAADHVVDVEDAEIGEAPASVDTRRPAEPAEVPGNFLEIPECLGLNPADSKWDRLATVRGKSAQIPSLIYNNVKGGALFLAGIPTAVTAAFPFTCMPRMNLGTYTAKMLQIPYCNARWNVCRNGVDLR